LQGEEEEEESIGLPDLQPDETLELINTDVSQQFTKPPARYNDASLIEKLEKEGIGRPSTYAAIIETVQKREYVVKIEKSFKPTQIGMVVSDLLVEGFEELMEMGYTRHLEEDLDLIEEGKKTYAATLHEFYKPFIKLVNSAGKKMQDLKAGVPTGESCPK
ncbi:MAG: DNA topoisomerase, partial [Holophagaceae bacterium]